MKHWHLFKTAAAADCQVPGVSAARGEQFFKAKHGKNGVVLHAIPTIPAASGKHASSGKIFSRSHRPPNAERFNRHGQGGKVVQAQLQRCTRTSLYARRKKGRCAELLLTVKK